MHKERLTGTPGQISARLDDLASGEDHRDYVAGTWFRELAVKLAARDDLAVSAIGYDGLPVRELEVALADAPAADPIVIDRDEPGSHCQITLERWLPISGDPAAEDAAAVIHAILAAGTRPAPITPSPGAG
jgi:hypothetical protein